MADEEIAAGFVKLFLCKTSQNPKSMIKSKKG
jgi:hypothetical protein